MVSLKLRVPRVSGHDAEMTNWVRFFVATRVKVSVTETVREPDSENEKFAEPFDGKFERALVFSSSIADCSLVWIMARR